MQLPIRKAVLTLAAAAAVTAGGGFALVSTASASTTRASGPATVTITTKSAGHYDTTNASGPATFSSPNGPVWAIDNLNETWKITACSASPVCTADNDGAQYAVTLTTPNSHFAEFANPGPEDSADGITSTCPAANAGGPRIGTGKVTGTIEYDVTANSGPDLSGVPAVQAPATSLDTVLGQIFDNTQTVVGGGHYDFKYADVCGSVYEQAG